MVDFSARLEALGRSGFVEGAADLVERLESESLRVKKALSKEIVDY